MSFVADTRMCREMLHFLIKVSYDGDPALTLQETEVVNT